MRSKKIVRKTKETQIELELNLDGCGKISVNTPLGFFNHLLELFAFHGGFNLNVKAEGDTFVDDHHLVEDVGIALGQALNSILGDRSGISRYGFFVMPMDEVLARVAIDIGGRSYLDYNVEITREKIGELSTECIKEFFMGFVRESKIALHIDILKTGNSHHIAEAVFKCFGRVLKMAVLPIDGNIPSTKGIIGE